MRLGIVTTSYPREPGDPAGSFVAGLARFVAGRGHEVEVVAAGPGLPHDGPIAVTRVDGAGLFYDEGAPDRLERSLLARLRAPRFAAALALATWAAHRRRRWDRVCSHWLLPSGIVAASLGLPHLAVAHSADVHLAARPLLADAVSAALLAGPSRVVFVAEHLRERLLSMCSVTRRSLSERSFSCPMGIDAAPQQRIARSRRPIVAFVGRLVPIKGADVLLAAARALPDTTFIVAGDGPERARLTRGAAPNVILPGELRGPARDALYASAHVVVVPSRELPSGRTEGAPTVIVEAFAAGVPVIASELPATRELRGALRLVPAGDVAALVTALRETLAGGLAVSTRVARGHERAAERDWSVVGQRLLDAWLAI